LDWSDEERDEVAAFWPTSFASGIVTGAIRTAASKNIKKYRHVSYSMIVLSHEWDISFAEQRREMH
jgi:hypothetical protein